ncbi:MAG: hypothetical protein KKE51_03500 [Gammaproteobacteria bacterium]|nr:hypothetical protein [Gammaproteobacteria bacterium]MBU1602171.1 hypothetical protein [Gammaproteobacteria bacterium]MBU2434218.1 hypothetical protein [Gammaproteobacteria bacterium]MBU2448458.1 hypothetical protein [Gammaproteobacteria bacterium]
MLDHDNAAFIQTGVSISLAACNVDRLPCMSRGLGCKLIDGGRQIAIFIKRSQSAELLENICNTGRVANVFNLPSSNRTLQLKGDDAQILPFDPADLPVIESHIPHFLDEVIPFGMQENMVRALFACTVDDLVTVVYTPNAAFTQTPGPKAGDPLGTAS